MSSINANAIVGSYEHHTIEEKERGSFHPGRPYSDGFYDCFIFFRNNSEKVINSVDFYCINAKPGGEGVLIHGKFDGPFQPNKKRIEVSFIKPWEAKKTEEVSIVKAIIEYADGTKEEIEHSEIDEYKKSGCYIATSVYGSYDCPEVWTLRRYRDECLAATWYGRAFIHVYYAVSPTLVKWFGKTKIFDSVLRKKLDKLVHKLESEGTSSQPYQDSLY